MLQRLNTLRQLPRDARDTLFLLVVIAWTMAPKVPALPLWCSVLAALLLLWRGWLAVKGRALPSRWWLVGLLVLVTGATLATYRTLLGQEAGVTFIVMLLALKTLEMRAQRDAFVIFFLGFFVLLSNFFVSQSLLTAASMLIALLGLLTALVNSHMPVGRPSLWQAAKTAGWMALLGAPIMAVLFMLFPRIAPLWGVPSEAPRARTGLSAQMQVGSIASLALDSSIAMRIQFEGVPPAQSDLYFRGPVLSSFDGRQWTPLRSAFPSRMQPQANLQVAGDPVRYQVTLEATQRPWILLLEASPEPPQMKGYTPRMTPDLQWLADRPLGDLVRYQAQSYPQFRHGPSNAVTALQDYLDLPPGFNPRTLQLATDMRRDPALALADAPTLINAVLTRLRTGGYTYTLEPGVYGTHTADEFWFDRKEGFCEHIASSFVLLMRALDVPARIVTGYHGGERNTVDGFWTVRQSDAHAWAEVWVSGQGWVRVDPTSAVAPSRTGSLQRLQAPAGAVAQVLGAVNPRLALNLRAMWEAANNRWNQWVLNYSQERQLNLLRNLGFVSPSWQDLGYVLAGLLVLASLLGATWTLWERNRQDPWLRLLHQAQKRLQATGLKVPPQAAPRQLAALLNAHAKLQSTPTQAQASIQNITQWLLAMESWRYRANTAPGGRSLATLQREYRQLVWPRNPV